jgi:hypothetical protein
MYIRDGLSFIENNNFVNNQNKIFESISIEIIYVRYHCGGWSEEVNSCILNSYMVYL